MKIAVLALQGAFAEHIRVMQELKVETVEIRQLKDLENNPDIAGLILPGGESTVQGKLLNELGLMEPLREKIRSGLPVLGTCAGLILLASGIANDSNRYFATLPVTVTRNAYGRQSGSFVSLDRGLAGCGKRQPALCDAAAAQACRLCPVGQRLVRKRRGLDLHLGRPGREEAHVRL